ncbi:hypothetical protein FRC20_002121 [Serendipita sp. 405]|nr:hypothetical protein FRC20_002121 [Serendipita sp. 405]
MWVEEGAVRYHDLPEIKLWGLSPISDSASQSELSSSSSIILPPAVKGKLLSSRGPLDAVAVPLDDQALELDETITSVCLANIPARLGQLLEEKECLPTLYFRVPGV